MECPAVATSRTKCGALPRPGFWHRRHRVRTEYNAKDLGTSAHHPVCATKSGIIGSSQGYRFAGCDCFHAPNHAGINTCMVGRDGICHPTLAGKRWSVGSQHPFRMTNPFRHGADCRFEFQARYPVGDSATPGGSMLRLKDKPRTTHAACREPTKRSKVAGNPTMPHHGQDANRSGTAGQCQSPIG